MVQVVSAPTQKNRAKNSAVDKHEKKSKNMWGYDYLVDG